MRLLTLSGGGFSPIWVVYVQFCPKAGEYSSAGFLRFFQAHDSLRWTLRDSSRYACTVLDAVQWKRADSVNAHPISEIFIVALNVHLHQR